MLLRWFFAIVCCSSALCVGAERVSGQTYPGRPIRILSGAVGGNGDFTARLIAQGITNGLGQPIIVENRGTIHAAQTVAQGMPDGYTLLALGSSFWIGPLMQKMPYDPVKQFSPIAATTSSPSILVVHPAVLARNVKELITLAKAKPGELNFAAATPGSAAHLAGELFRWMAGVSIVAVPYKGASAALNDLVGARVQLMFASPPSVALHVKSGRLNALAVSSAQPSALLPGLPTVASSGLPGYESDSRQGIWAPAKAQAAVIKRLNHEIVQVLGRADVKEKLFSIGAEPTASSPEDFARIMDSDMARMDRVIKAVGIKVNVE